MYDHSLKIRFASLLVLALAALFVYTPALQSEGSDSGASCEAGLLCVSYLDVGQGDATLIESPSRTQLLIDGGRDASVLQELAAVMGYFDREIDVVLATHPDTDHIGGLIDVLEKYEVGTIVLTENEGDSPAARQFAQLVREHEARGGRTLYARAGDTISLGTGEYGEAVFTILFPDRNPKGFESNASSIIGELTYGEAEFLFTGDAPESIEKYLIGKHKTEIQSDVLKAGHHGSKTSSAPEFVAAVAPAYAVISAGKDNSYGHPHQEVLDVFAAQGVPTKNTADEGSIFMVSNGETIWLR